MFMSRCVPITNRHLVTGPLRDQIGLLVAGGIRPIVLREKDLPQGEYAALARAVIPLMKTPGDCILHHHIDVARDLHHPAIHLPLPDLRCIRGDWLDFEIRGASVHSVSEALEAQALGATYLIASPIFKTSCKPGVSPKGPGFIRELVWLTGLPIYALGGIDPHNAQEALEAGAAGVCLMSAAMGADEDGVRRLGQIIR
ncbi:thiamine phosphate synthase [Eubacterium sp.]|uniref:thiamine phosphate synthase n=1 Tax=Eubacterium sp. TaxID=142586 RepID=UPI002FCAAE3C